MGRSLVLPQGAFTEVVEALLRAHVVGFVVLVPHVHPQKALTSTSQALDAVQVDYARDTGTSCCFFMFFLIIPMLMHLAAFGSQHMEIGQSLSGGFRMLQVFPPGLSETTDDGSPDL